MHQSHGEGGLCQIYPSCFPMRFKRERFMNFGQDSQRKTSQHGDVFMGVHATMRMYHSCHQILTGRSENFQMIGKSSKIWRGKTTSPCLRRSVCQMLKDVQRCSMSSSRHGGERRDLLTKRTKKP